MHSCGQYHHVQWVCTIMYSESCTVTNTVKHEVSHHVQWVSTESQYNHVQWVSTTCTVSQYNHVQWDGKIKYNESVQSYTMSPYNNVQWIINIRYKKITMKNESAIWCTVSGIMYCDSDPWCIVSRIMYSGSVKTKEDILSNQQTVVLLFSGRPCSPWQANWRVTSLRCYW